MNQGRIQLQGDNCLIPYICFGFGQPDLISIDDTPDKIIRYKNDHVAKDLIIKFRNGKTTPGDKICFTGPDLIDPVSHFEIHATTDDIGEIAIM